MAERAAIQDLFADYGWGNDAKDEALLRSVFTEDARFEITIAGVGAPIEPLDGRDAIVGFIHGTVAEQTDQRRHVVVNHRVWPAADHDRVRAYLSLHVIDGGVLTVQSSGVYDTEVVEQDGRLQFRSMKLALDAPF